jgi:hypothetical protein
MSARRHRDREAHERVVALSTSYHREDLMARGLGFEHLRELLLRVARPLLRSDARIAFGGAWAPSEHNLMYPLLHLISSELEDNTAGGPDTRAAIGRLINHVAWPHSRQVTPQIEAQWINCCQIVRVSQSMAGIGADEQLDAVTADPAADRYVYNRALCMSAMRQLATTGMRLDIPDAPTEWVPPISARVVVGGKLAQFSGFMPGVFEEVRLALEAGQPTYILGGFGGAAAALADALTGAAPRPELTYDGLARASPELARLELLGATLTPAPGPFTTTEQLRRLHAAIAPGPAALRTGLSDDDTREMLTTADLDRAVALVRRGLQITLGIKVKPA